MIVGKKRITPEQASHQAEIGLLVLWLCLLLAIGWMKFA